MQFVDSLPNGSVIKNPSANVGDTGDRASIPGSGKPPGGRRGKSLHYSFFLLRYSCLENPRDRGVCILGYSPRGRKTSDTTE